MAWSVIFALVLKFSLHCLCLQEDISLISPQNCSLDCIIKGKAICEYCRITREDVSVTLGVSTEEMFGSCVPWPCSLFLGVHIPAVCQHYVHAPHDINVEFLPSDSPVYDTAIISWRPSLYGLSFLRGFQVSLQALGGTQTDCQLFLFQSNLTLTAAQAGRVYRSDPFQLALDAQFAVTVMALPVPELWSNFYHSKYFSTRSCLEKNGLEQCLKDWYPSKIEVEQDGHDVIVTFNLAPPNLGINQYFSWCYGGGMRNYTVIKAKPTGNKTHHSYRLLRLKPETRYSCELAADVVDAIRKTFNFQVMGMEHRKESSTFTTDGSLLALLLPVLVLLAILLSVFIFIVSKKKLKRSKRKTKMAADVIMQHDSKCVLLEQNLVLLERPRPPRLLICYSNVDGPAHIRAVMLLAAFIQQHMATQVFLDLWEALSVLEEGLMSWLCRRMEESDFVLVVCSRGLQHGLQRNAQGVEESQEAEESQEGGAAAVAVSLIGEALARAQAGGQGLSKYMTVVFDHSSETDVPPALGLAARYSLMRDLPLLFSHLHGVALQGPGRHLQVEHISAEAYHRLPAGAALRWALQQAGQED
ncbi:interleukin-17 receptor D [Conger conger]|uniref:interleukin-17 receptor D n=1 Tax=Conger conger TaxID=82655 RepID=UPI002A59BB5A|nr:interleukin-17 receptor D [Conger conger]